jgi:hypothetical protein
MVHCSKYAERGFPKLMTQKPRGRMPLHKASATKVAAGGSVGKVTPSGAEPVVSVIDAISETRQKPKTNMQVQEASATQAVMRDAIEKMAPAAAGPVVSVIDAISDTTQQTKASAPVQETLAAKGGREAVEQVTPAAGEPVVSKTQAISETLVASPAAVTEERVKPIAAIKSTNPNSNRRLGCIRPGQRGSVCQIRPDLGSRRSGTDKAIRRHDKGLLRRVGLGVQGYHLGEVGY